MPMEVPNLDTIVFAVPLLYLLLTFLFRVLGCVGRLEGCRAHIDESRVRCEWDAGVLGSGAGESRGGSFAQYLNVLTVL